MKEIVVAGGKIVCLADDIAEVIVSDGIEVSGEMVDETRQTLLEYFDCPCNVLINRVNSYHYSFEAQQRMADLDCVDSVAVLSQSSADEITARIVRLFPGKGRWKVSFFADRNSAVEWLERKRTS